MDLSEFEYIWDGSDPGWVLSRSNEVRWRIELLFGSEGAALQDVQRARAVPGPFADLPAAQALRQLRGQRRCLFGDTYSEAQCRRTAQRLEAVGLTTSLVATMDNTGLPLSPNRSALLIENEDLAAAVSREMYRRGLPVRYLND